MPTVFQVTTFNITRDLRAIETKILMVGRGGRPLASDALRAFLLLRIWTAVTVSNVSPTLDSADDVMESRRQSCWPSHKSLVPGLRHALQLQLVSSPSPFPVSEYPNIPH